MTLYFLAFQNVLITFPPCSIVKFNNFLASHIEQEIVNIDITFYSFQWLFSHNSEDLLMQPFRPLTAWQKINHRFLSYWCTFTVRTAPSFLGITLCTRARGHYPRLVSSSCRRTRSPSRNRTVCSRHPLWRVISVGKYSDFHLDQKRVVTAGACLYFFRLNTSSLLVSAMEAQFLWRPRRMWFGVNAHRSSAFSERFFINDK